MNALLKINTPQSEAQQRPIAEAIPDFLFMDHQEDKSTAQNLPNINNNEKKFVFSRQCGKDHGTDAHTNILILTYEDGSCVPNIDGIQVNSYCQQLRMKKFKMTDEEFRRSEKTKYKDPQYRSHASNQVFLADINGKLKYQKVVPIQGSNHSLEIKNTEVEEVDNCFELSIPQPLGSFETGASTVPLLLLEEDNTHTPNIDCLNNNNNCQLVIDLEEDNQSHGNSLNLEEPINQLTYNQMIQITPIHMRSANYEEIKVQQAAVQNLCTAECIIITNNSLDGEICMIIPSILNNSLFHHKIELIIAAAAANNKFNNSLLQLNLMARTNQQHINWRGSKEQIELKELLQQIDHEIEAVTVPPFPLEENGTVTPNIVYLDINNYGALMKEKRFKMSDELFCQEVNRKYADANYCSEIVNMLYIHSLASTVLRNTPAAHLSGTGTPLEGHDNT